MKGSESRLQVGGVGLEIVESASNAGLELRGVLARWAVGRDLVEGTHGCWLCRGEFRDDQKVFGGTNKVVFANGSG